jgi:hypothetical protein
MLILGTGLSACGSDEPQRVLNSERLASSTAAGLGIQVSPATTPVFDAAVHDYVIDCTTSPDVKLSVALPQSIGFEFLGTSGTSSGLQVHDSVQFSQSMTLAPGQGLRFAIAGHDSYSIRCLPPDFPPLTTTVSGTPQAQWYLFTPNLGNTAAPYVAIVDSHGTPVWWYREAVGQGSDAKLIGDKNIAWAAQDSAGNGQYVVRDFAGQVAFVLTGSLDGHDLQPTANGTFLAIRYVQRVCPPDCADMSQWGGSAQQAVIDAEILELDKDSKVVWSWKTRDHIDLSETGGAGWFPDVGADIIHMNALQPDGADGLFFSARHLNAIYRITKSTGAIDWKLGGTQRPESLTVLGDTRPTAQGVTLFSGQHDVRKWADGTVSVHDNGSGYRSPAILRFRIDTTNRTAEVLELVQDARVTASACCGSARRLDGGHWLVQWGASPFATELDSSGNPVLTIQYNLGAVFSYRAIPIQAGILPVSRLRNGMDTLSRK